MGFDVDGSIFEPPPLVTYRPWWIKNDALPWTNVGSYIRSVLNIFPILDTVWGTPCATVSNLQAVDVDSTTATVMWSADARHHEWEVYCFPTDDSTEVVLQTVETPTATLAGLLPGKEYGVTVVGLCDEKNYSPMSDTLLFTTPHGTTEIVDTTQTQGIQRLGNLDRFTSIMPNPASDVVNVVSSYRLESIAVYDLSGHLLLEESAEGISAEVNVSPLPHGTYIMAIRTQQGVATKKLLVGN